MLWYDNSAELRTYNTPQNYPLTLILYELARCDRFWVRVLKRENCSTMLLLEKIQVDSWHCSFNHKSPLKSTCTGTRHALFVDHWTLQLPSEPTACQSFFLFTIKELILRRKNFGMNIFSWRDSLEIHLDLDESRAVIIRHPIDCTLSQWFWISFRRFSTGVYVSIQKRMQWNASLEGPFYPLSRDINDPRAEN